MRVLLKDQRKLWLVAVVAVALPKNNL